MRNVSTPSVTNALLWVRSVLALPLLILCGLVFSSTAGAQSFTLTINTLGSGTVTADPAGPYAAGAVVTLSAMPSSGSSFSSWSGDLTGYANPGTLIVNGNSTVTATFDQIGYAAVTGDSRTINEPTFPPVCATLLAQQSASSLNQSLFDTSRLQTAINNCPAGQAVQLSSSSSSNAFLTQPIVLKAGITLLIDAEVTLFGSNNKSDYNCGSDCTPLIQAAVNTGIPGSGIMGYGIIDGQGSVWWGSDPRPRLVFVGDPVSHASSDNFTFYKTTLQNSPKFNLYAISNGLTVWGAKVTNPGNSPNTDGIDPSASSNITIRDSYISTGDDHIAIKGGFGHVSNMTITHNHLYHGHGLSMGSETNAGIENVLATDNVINQNGCSGCSSSNDIRIKSDSSRGGEVKNVLYQDTCIRNGGTQPHEFVLNPFYTSATGSLIPNFHDIHLHNMRMVDAGNKSTFEGFDGTKVLTTFLDNVVFDALNSSDFSSSLTSNAAFTLGPGPVSFVSKLTAAAPSDTNVTVTNNVSTSNPAYDCNGRFVYLAGELFTTTPTVAAGSPVTLTSVLQPIIFGSAAPTGTISILEGGKSVASASINGRITQITVSGVSPGTHTYTASYSGDANYAQLFYGKLVVATSGGGGGDFTISAAPGSQTVTAGGSTSYTGTVAPSGGFTGSVSFTVSGLPSGATGSFNPTSVAGSGSSTLAIATARSTPPGTYTLTITGTSGSLVHSTTTMLVVNPPPDFTLSATPGSQTVTAGAGTSYTASVSAVNGFAGAVTFSVSGLPSGATGSFNPTSVAGSGTSTLTVTTSTSTAAGTYTLTITGTSASLAHSATATLVVNAAPDFTLSVTPGSQTVTVGSGTSYTASVTEANGFAGTVNFSVSGLPSGATGSFSPTSVTSSGSSTLSVSTSSTTPAGTYSLTITATSGSLVHSVAVSLVVNATSSSLFTFSVYTISPNPSQVGTSTKVGMMYTDTGTGSTSQTFTLAFQVVNSSGAVVATHSTSASMSTGSTHQSSLNFTPSAAGTYTVQGTVKDSSGTVVGQNNNVATFTVN